jgi:hypothetical protein
MQRIVVLLSVVCLGTSLAAAASPAPALHQEVAAVRAGHGARPEACSFLPISCNQTVNNSLGASGCSLEDGQLADLYQFNGTAGTAVTATMISTDFSPFLDLLDPADNTAADSEGATIATVSFTLDASGAWTLGATNADGLFEVGNYSLSLQCSTGSGGGTGTCTADANTLCLNSNRFQVTATYNAGTSGSGNANVVSMTDDTGYLWFFGASNVETVIKILNGCGTGGHYWVFAGGLTNVKVVITVTDTQTGATKTYTNPQGAVFQPIQDTAAFSTCP